MKRISKNIADGAMSFLKAEYKVLSVFVFSVAILLYFKGGSDTREINGEIKASPKDHLKNQLNSLRDLNRDGFHATFQWDFDQIKSLIDGYMKRKREFPLPLEKRYLHL